MSDAVRNAVFDIAINALRLPKCDSGRRTLRLALGTKFGLPGVGVQAIYRRKDEDAIGRQVARRAAETAESKAWTKMQLSNSGRAAGMAPWGLGLPIAPA